MTDDKRLNEVIRVQKRKNNFVTLDKTFLENENLSWKAKGILAYLLSKPDNWKVIVKDLVNHATDGKSAVYSGLNELKEQGYYDKKPVRDENGRRISHWEGTVRECPAESLVNTPNSLLTDFLEIENQDIENQDTENRERNNNYINNNYFNKNQSSQVLSVGQDGQDKADGLILQMVEDYTEIIKENIDYESLTIAYSHDMVLVDEIIFIIIDALMTDSKTVQINGENKPKALVKSVLMRLDYENIDHVLTQFKAYTKPVAKKRQFILTMLYNAKAETNSHYSNLYSSRRGNPSSWVNSK